MPYLLMALSAHAEPHLCAAFGGTAGTACDNYPDWGSGFWKPPAQVRALHVLIVGGGGAGGGSIDRGIGGTGGASGQVINATIELPPGDEKIIVAVGAGGRGGSRYRVAGGHGRPSLFATLAALGGEGGRPWSGGGALPASGATSPSASPPGCSGGGGGGGGTYQKGGAGGDGGAGGVSGSLGIAGKPGTDAPVPVNGTNGGAGAPFPGLGFSLVPIAAGNGGDGGAHGSLRIGYGGGGGGGGGGVVLARLAPNASPGASGVNLHDALGGAGGRGFGAGGGGGGNYVVGAHGGSGTRGVIYVEWVQVVSQAP